MHGGRPAEVGAQDAAATMVAVPTLLLGQGMTAGRLLATPGVVCAPRYLEDLLDAARGHVLRDPWDRQGHAEATRSPSGSPEAGGQGCGGQTLRRPKGVGRGVQS